MISKELFVDTLNKIQEQDNKIAKLSSVLGEFCDGYPVFDCDNLYLQALLNILTEELKDENDFIGWWLWENVEKTVFSDEGDEWDLTTPEALYNFLVENYAEK